MRSQIRDAPKYLKSRYFLSSDLGFELAFLSIVAGLHLFLNRSGYRLSFFIFGIFLAACDGSHESQRITKTSDPLNTEHRLGTSTGNGLSWLVSRLYLDGRHVKVSEKAAVSTSTTIGCESEWSLSDDLTGTFVVEDRLEVQFQEEVYEFPLNKVGEIELFDIIEAILKSQAGSSEPCTLTPSQILDHRIQNGGIEPQIACPLPQRLVANCVANLTAPEIELEAESIQVYLEVEANADDVEDLVSASQRR